MRRAARRPVIVPSAVIAFAALAGAGLAITTATAFAADGASTRGVIIARPQAPFAEALAAREVRRFIWMRTGELLPIVASARNAPAGAARIAVLTKGARAPRSLSALAGELSGLAEDEVLLRTTSASGNLCIAGGSPAATLQAAYRFAERLGIRFALHGETAPDARIPFALPTLQERARPLFALRGIQPFHDFPEGPDWWNRDDYLVYISSLPKLGMNFFGLHTYPEAGPNAEPAVWIGPPSEVGERGEVKAAYPSSWQNTLRGNWGYVARATSRWSHGTAALFERDDFGAAVMADRCPEPGDLRTARALFDDAGAMLRDVFAHARRIGVKTCVGTETPLAVPKAVAERLRAAGKDPGNPAVVEELYLGIFTRIARAYPVDWYWLWTPEGWTWSGIDEKGVKSTIGDIEAAFRALKRAGDPFRLATCGWVLGPPSDRALFDTVLPKEIALSCINRQVGMEAVDPGFARVAGRGKWAIPWMEDDPALTSLQLWAGRMREDAALAREYGCDGLLGIHWRTRVLSPTVAALAKAAWDQSWRAPAAATATPAIAEGPEGGSFAAFPAARITGADDPEIYRTVRYDVSAYRFRLPDGLYRVVLKFCEPHYGEAGKRVFGVKLQGKTVVDRLDIFERAGKDRALDLDFPGVEVRNGLLQIEFPRIVEYPSIAAISIEGKVDGKEVSRRVDCGGPGHGRWAADWPAGKARPRGLPVDDFYRDWATAEFGPAAGPRLAAVFARIDSRLPRPSDWVDGPGGLKPDARPWSEIEEEYGFVDELAGMKSLPMGPGEHERFEYWAHTFRYMKAVARVDALWHQATAALEAAKAKADPAARAAEARERALPARRKLLAAVDEVFVHLLATVSTPGEMGTVANWEQHIFPMLLDRPGEELARALGEPLPADALPRVGYHDAPRLIVPTVRTSVAPGEPLELKLIVLDGAPPREVMVEHREMGSGPWSKAPVERIARGVHRARIPAAGKESLGIEYVVRVMSADGTELVYPPGAPGRAQAVTVEPAE